jgi:hypothetical protein
MSWRLVWHVRIFSSIFTTILTVRSKPFPIGGTIGTAISGLVLGLLAAYIFVLFQAKAKRKKESRRLFTIEDPQSPSGRHAGEHDPSAHLLHQYQVEPFAFPHEKSPMLGDHPSSPTSNATNLAPYSPASDGKSFVQAAGSSSTSQQQRPPSPVGPPQVYVVHHDAGRAPTTVYTASGTVVEELPPVYPSGPRGRASANADPGPAAPQPAN